MDIDRLCVDVWNGDNDGNGGGGGRGRVWYKEGFWLFIVCMFWVVEALGWYVKKFVWLLRIWG